MGSEKALLHLAPVTGILLLGEPDRFNLHVEVPVSEIQFPIRLNRLRHDFDDALAQSCASVSWTLPFATCSLCRLSS